MWIPRLTSLAILIVAAISSYLAIDSFKPSSPVQVIDLLLLFTFFASAFGCFAGAGGIIASFGLEYAGRDCFRPKDTVLGGFISKVISGTQSFCGVSAVCGLMLMMIALCSATVTLLIYVSFMEPRVLLFVLAACLLIAAMSWFAKHYEKAFAWTMLSVIFGGTIAFVAYQIITKGAPKAPVSFEGLADIITAYLVAFTMFGVFLLAKWLLKKARFYSSICPTRLPGPTTEY